MDTTVETESFISKEMINISAFLDHLSFFQMFFSHFIHLFRQQEVKPVEDPKT